MYIYIKKEMPSFDKAVTPEKMSYYKSSPRGNFMAIKKKKKRPLAPE